MEPTDYLNALRRRWLVVLVLALIGASVGAYFAISTPSQYRATSSVYVTAQRASSSQEVFAGNEFSVAAVQSFIQLATMPAVLKPAIDELGLHESPARFAKSVSATSQSDTVIIDITATDGSAARSAAVSRAVADSLVREASALAPRADGRPALSLTVVSAAETPAVPFAPSRPLFVVIGLVLGLAAGVLVALLRAVFGNQVTSERDLARATDAPVLGRIGRFSGTAVIRRDPLSAVAEEYRRIRTNLEFADIDAAARVVVITSAQPGEGKSTTALNVALAMAESSQKVLLVDADLRKPSVAVNTGLDGSVGLTTVLLGRARLTDAVQDFGDTGLKVLPSGELPPNPSQLLGSAAFARLVETLRKDYDYVVVDAPPLIPVTDALKLVPLADGAVLVALNRSTRVGEFARAVESLELINATLLGVVLNQAQVLVKQAYYGNSGDAGKRKSGRVRKTVTAVKVQQPAMSSESR